VRASARAMPSTTITGTVIAHCDHT
jgi:hypothetical protein